MADKTHLTWMLGKLKPREKTVFLILLTMGTVQIVLGIVLQFIVPSQTGFNLSVLTWWLALGLFSITMSFLHALISLVRAAEES